MFLLGGEAGALFCLGRLFSAANEQRRDSAATLERRLLKTGDLTGCGDVHGACTPSGLLNLERMVESEF